MRRVAYHQSVFDLLDMQPKESPQAREMIEACEARSGRRLPEAVRQWYLIDRVVTLRHDTDWQTRARNEQQYLWYDYSNMDWPESLETVLLQFAGELTEIDDDLPGRPPPARRSYRGPARRHGAGHDREPSGVSLVCPAGWQ
jgi:hypothetical protein